MPVAKPSSNEFVRFGVYVLSHLGYLFKKASVNTKQKIISSIFKEKLVFEGERYRTPTLNRGLELITRSISNLEAIKNRKRETIFRLPRQCLSGLHLSTERPLSSLRPGLLNDKLRPYRAILKQKA